MSYPGRLPIMMGCVTFITTLAVLLMYCSISVFASDYVLPYPSFMPGHRLYAIHRAWSRVDEFWHFGAIARIKYHRQRADTLLVEAKTLFEYGQYEFAARALLESNKHFARAVLYDKEIGEQQKDTGEQHALLKASGEKHTEIIGRLSNELPGQIVWEPENREPQIIDIGLLLRQAEIIRAFTNETQ